MARIFIAEVTYTKRLRVTVGGEGGSIRLDDEDDADAAEAIVNDYAHLPDYMLPSYVKIEHEDFEIEAIDEIIDAKAERASLTTGDRRDG